MRISTRNASPRARFIERFNGRWAISRGDTFVGICANLGDDEHTAFIVKLTLDDDPAMLDRLISSLTRLRSEIPDPEVTP